MIWTDPPGGVSSGRTVVLMWWIYLSWCVGRCHQCLRLKENILHYTAESVNHFLLFKSCPPALLLFDILFEPLIQNLFSGHVTTWLRLWSC